LKKNQQELYDDMVCGFKACSLEDISEEWEYDQGEYETRKCGIIKSQEVLLLENQQLLSNLITLIKIESTRIIKDRQVQETCYYISDE
jgi:hypothetical protein